MAVPDVVVVTDRYHDPATGRDAGTGTKLTAAGAVLSAQDVASIEGRCRSCDIAEACADGDWPLADAGAETVTVDGRDYSCAKYTADGPGGPYAVWVAGGVPAPVKIEAASPEGTRTWELTGWG